MNKALSYLQENLTVIEGEEYVPLSVAKEAIKIELFESGVGKYQEQLDKYIQELNKSLGSITKKVQEDNIDD